MSSRLIGGCRSELALVSEYITASFQRNAGAVVIRRIKQFPALARRKQADDMQQLRNDVQALREENKKLLERLDRLEARQRPAPRGRLQRTMAEGRYTPG